MDDVRSVVEWLMDGARSAPRAEDLLRELCHRMIAGGIPVWRAAIFVNTLHPNIFGRRFTWQAATGSLANGLRPNRRQWLLCSVGFRCPPVNWHLAPRWHASSKCSRDRLIQKKPFFGPINYWRSWMPT